MKLTETVEKISLPDVDTISSDRQQADADLLSGLQGGVELRRTETRLPLNPLGWLQTVEVAGGDFGEEGDGSQTEEVRREDEETQPIL